MKQFFGATFKQALAICAILFFLSFLGYGSSFSGTLLFGLATAAAILSYLRVDRALYLVFIELFINPHGVILSTDFHGFTVSLRMAIFIGVMTGWACGILMKRYRLNAHDGRLQIFTPLMLAAALGFIGSVNDDLRFAFSDGNAYFYLLYLFPILCVSWTHKHQGELLQIFAAGALWVAGFSLALLYLFTHLGQETLRVSYYLLRDLRMAEVTRLGEGIYRVFIQSQVFTIIFGLLLCSESVFIKDKHRLIFFASICIATLILALSRSFWLGAFFALIFLCGLLFMHLKPTFKTCFFFMGKASISLITTLVLLVAISLFPFPGQQLSGSALADAFVDRTQIDDVAVSSRWKLLRPMVNKIFEEPLLGSGFGTTVTFQTDDPRVRAINPNGTWTTHAMEWGWLELWIKMGILGPLAFLYAGYELLRRLWAYRWGDQAWLGFGLMSGLIFIYATHFFSPYLNHPIGLGFLLFLVPFLPIKRPAETSVLFTLPERTVAEQVPVLTSK